MPKPQRTAFYRGSAGRDKAEEELAVQKQKSEDRKARGNDPFRFKVKVGESTQFIIVDDEPEFYRFEHNMEDKATKRWNIFTGCVKEWDNCPVCEETKRESYYALYLTVIDFTPFTTRDGTTVDFSRKLLVVKPGQQKKFHRAYARAQKEGRTLRGALFDVSRDGDKDSSIGNDLELVEFVEEEEIETYVRSWKDKEGKKQTENCGEVYDYESLFEEPDTEALRALVGGTAPAGNRKQEDRDLGRTRPGSGRAAARGRAEADEDSDDDSKWDKPARSERMPASRARRGAAAPEDDDVVDDAPPPRRGTRPSRAAEPDEAAEPERRSRGRARAAEADDDVDDAPPPRGRSATAPRGRPAARQEEPADDVDDAPPPRRGAVPGVGRRGGR